MQLGYQGRHLIQIIITRGEKDILHIDNANIVQNKTGNNHTPIYNPPIEQRRYTGTKLIQERYHIGLKT